MSVLWHPSRWPSPVLRAVRALLILSIVHGLGNIYAAVEQQRWPLTALETVATGFDIYLVLATTSLLRRRTEMAWLEGAAR